MRRGRAVAERGGDPYQLIPLFPEQRCIDRALDDLIEAAIVLGAIQLVELLLGASSWHPGAHAARGDVQPLSAGRLRLG